MNNAITLDLEEIFVGNAHKVSFYMFTNTYKKLMDQLFLVLEEIKCSFLMFCVSGCCVHIVA